MILDGDVLHWYLSILDTNAIVERTREQVAQELPPERMGGTEAERDAYWHGVRIGAAIIRDAILSFVQAQGGTRSGSGSGSRSRSGSGEDVVLH